MARQLRLPTYIRLSIGEHGERIDKDGGLIDVVREEYVTRIDIYVGGAGASDSNVGTGVLPESASLGVFWGSLKCIW
jgi:hypothetical protein